MANFEIPKAYEPQKYEDSLYQKWEESGFFNPDNLPGRRQKSFTISLPPPNATGVLHIGHAVMLAIQDLVIRFQRLQGKKTLWLPGTDHAAIATQTKVEKLIKDKEGKTRFDLGREDFLKRVNDYVKKSQNTIKNQIRKMGSSCDWSRERYTLDQGLTLAVHTAFVEMYQDGLIYRRVRVVNWCPRCQTALSDEEAVHKEVEGALYYINYPIEGSKDHVTLATTRPETMLGDTAVAINPKDERYSHLRGKKVILPLLNRAIPVIEDDFVDPDFGTGIVKVTPAHDPNDFQMGIRHKLERINVLNPDGTVNEKGGPYKGLDRFEARKRIVHDLEGQGLFVKRMSHGHAIGHCYRCETVVEPYLSKQWFVKMKPLAEKALKAHRDEKVKFYPERWNKVYTSWLENIRDWCISRQIWWGIQIPVWYCLGCGNIKVNAQVKSRWFIVRHGETDWNKTGKILGTHDIELNDAGRAQAKNVGQMLKSADIELIISSPYARALETAKIIAEATGAEIITDNEFREKSNGEAEGMIQMEAFKKYGDLHHFDRVAPEGESYRELSERVHQAFRDHKEKHGHKNVLLVSHGGVIRTLVGKIKNLAPEEMMSRESIKNCEVVSLDILSTCEKCGGDLYEQDPDTLDTWFSSVQWPYATLMANGKKDIDNYFPTDTLVTGSDILFFWVARMIMFSYYCMSKEPFKTVLLHGLVRDKDKQKMSKSKGNAVDPLGIIDTYGADALRFGLIFATAAESDIALSEDRIRGMKHFANKLWNIARFVFANAENMPVKSQKKPQPITEADALILKKLDETIKNVTKNLENFALHEAAQEIYQFIWHELADIYIEASKSQLKDEAQKKNTEEILKYALLTSLKLLHPFMPFVTEEIYQKMNGETGGSEKLLMVEAWPR